MASPPQAAVTSGSRLRRFALFFRLLRATTLRGRFNHRPANEVRLNVWTSDAQTEVTQRYSKRNFVRFIIEPTRPLKKSWLAITRASLPVFGHLTIPYLRDFFSFAILIARTFFMILRNVALSAEERVFLAMMFQFADSRSQLNAVQHFSRIALLKKNLIETFEKC
jgi:hypothetical protein